jgi:hypothetical protein
MSYSVMLYERDYSKLQAVSSLLTLTAQSYGFAAIGGPSSASISVSGPQAELLQAADWIMCPVAIYQDGEIVWWGFVHDVALNLGGVSVGVSMEKLANRIAVAYELAVVGSTTGERATTAQTNDTDSQAEYGIKELLATSTASTATAATTYRDRLLDALATPPKTLGMGDGSLGVTLECKGWWETFGWRTYDYEGAWAGSLGQGENSGLVLVMDDTYFQAYQSFQLRAADDDNFYAAALDIHLTKTGTGGNPLKFYITSDLTTDGSGDPVNVLAYGTTTPSDYGNDAWHKIALNTMVLLQPSTTYYLWVRPAGAWSFPTSDYCTWVTYDPTSYAEGALYSGNNNASPSWSVQAGDASFGVYGYRDTAQQVSDIATAVKHARIGAIQLDTTSGVKTSATRAAESNALTEIQALLEVGCSDGQRMLAEITRQRILRVYKEPTADVATDYMLTADGKVWTSKGIAVKPSTFRPGVWVRLRDTVLSDCDALLSRLSPIFIEGTEYDCASGKLSLTARDHDSVWELGGVKL